MRTLRFPSLCLLIIFSYASEANHVTTANSKIRRRRRRIGRHAPLFHGGTTESPPFTLSNLTCSFIIQPLNHFDLPRNISGNYRQRYCYYSGFATSREISVDGKVENAAPVFLYVGNESPIETYINHTGLMWELAPKFGAIVVFLEHRYEGESLPDPRSTLPPTGHGCMAYSSSIQALADAAYFIQNVLFTSDLTFNNPSPPSVSTLHRRPVIAFGGSYGGMLAAWLRMKYPSVVAGAIAASAPIWGLPIAMTHFESNVSTVIDSASQVIATGLSQSYPPSESNNKNENISNRDQDDKGTNHCPSNLLAVWPLIKVLSQYAVGRKLLEDSFLLCKKLPNETSSEDVAQMLIDWAQSPWFDLAEGSYPYPSSYISYALTHQTDVKLPSWPVQSACWRNSTLYRNIGIIFDGNLSQVEYTITYGTNNLSIHVDWDRISVELPVDVHSMEDLLTTRTSFNDTISTLLKNVRSAVGVWYNASLNLKCFDIESVAPNLKTDETDVVKSTADSAGRNLNRPQESSESICKRKIKEEGSWPSLNCNEEMNLIITSANGIGNDVFWPPTVPRLTRTYSDLLNVSAAVAPCLDDDGFFGYPQQSPDPWSSWYDTVFGGRNIFNSASNIVFSNGKLDPWSAAGVLCFAPPNSSQPVGIFQNISTYNSIPGLQVHFLTPTVIAVDMELGGHHTDLMYSNIELDPICITHARLLEQQNIDGWIKNFWDTEP